jgi:HK97 family phage portal protein
VAEVPAVVAYPPVPQLPAPTVERGLVERIRAWAFPTPRTATPEAIAYQQAGGITVIGQTAPLVWKANANTYRAWSLTPWVRSAIKIRREQIAGADWDIVPADKEGRQNKRLARRIRDLIETPNAKITSFHSFAQELLEDLLVLDGAACEKVRYPSGELAELWPTPGEYIAIDPRWTGSDPDEYRYYYIPDGQVRAKFKNADMLYMMDNPRTVSAMGISPIEVLKTVIDSEYQAMQYNRRMVMGAAPSGALNIGEGASATDVEKARSKLEAEVFGQSSMAVIGGYKNPSWMPFNQSNKDMQFREWQDLLLRCIAVVYGLSPMDLGITFDVNRSSAEQQAANTEDRGLRPLLDLFQRYLTKEVVQDESYGGKENNLAFAFSALNLSETKQKADINKIAVGGVAWKTVNEARVMDGRQPLGEMEDEENIFNHILIMSPKGLIDLTDEKFVGEEQLAELATDAQTTAITAQANADAEQARTEAAAKLPPKA